MCKAWGSVLVITLSSGAAWGQPREWLDDLTTVATYDSVSLWAPCNSGPSTRYTMLEALGGDIYNGQFLSGGGQLIFTNRQTAGLLGRLEVGIIGVLDLGQPCPDNPDPNPGTSNITSEPFTSPDVCMYGGVRFDAWQARPGSGTYKIKGPDNQPGVAGVDDDLDGVTDDDDESPAARSTTVNGGYGNRDGTGFRAGVDAKPGVAGVDDNGNGIVDDHGEIGWPLSDDGDDTTHQAVWFMLDASLASSSSIVAEMDIRNPAGQFEFIEINSSAWHVVQYNNELAPNFCQADRQYNWVFCSSGTCYGAMLWTGTDMSNPNETLGPVLNSEHTEAGDNAAGFGFYQTSIPLQYIRRQQLPGNTNFSDSFWVVSGNPAQYYPSPSADLDADRDVDGFDFLTFSNCYNGSNKPPLAACANGRADLDRDGDVDGFDFLTFSNCYNGSNRKPLSACFPPNLTACGS